MHQTSENKFYYYSILVQGKYYLQFIDTDLSWGCGI